MNRLESSITFFDTVVVKALRFVVAFVDMLRRIQEMLHANRKLLGFRPQVHKIAFGKKRHTANIVKGGRLPLLAAPSRRVFQYPLCGRSPPRNAPASKQPTAPETSSFRSHGFGLRPLMFAQRLIFFRLRAHCHATNLSSPRRRGSPLLSEKGAFIRKRTGSACSALVKD